MIPLTVRSHYSLMWGVHAPQNICRAAKKLGYACLALTDTDNLYGLWPFLNACRQEDLRPIVGAELTDPVTGQRAVCLVENCEGYRNLCRLITQRHRDPMFSLETAVISHCNGLVVLTRSQKLLGRWYAAGVTVAAAAPRRPGNRSLHLRKAARHLGVPLAATSGSFFLNPEDFGVHRTLRAIDLNTCLSRIPPGDTAPADAWLAPPAEYARRFDIWPEAVAATHALAEQLTFNGPERGLAMPPWSDTGGLSAGQALRNAAYHGARRRYGNDLPETVVDRLEHELQVIADMGFSAYFLVVQDIVSRSPRICGRGSAAASLTAFCLGITNVCPIKHNLYFGRFLNPGRRDPPDIDVDFAWDERDAVIAGVLQQYNGHAALVCNHVTFGPRMAVRETARVSGLSDREIGRVTQKLPWFRRPGDIDRGLLIWMKQMPEMRGLDFSEPWPRILALAERIIGVPRHLSVHPGGVVITPGPICDYVPLETAPKKVPIIQWEKNGAEEAGMVKIDLLGNRSLGVIRDALANLRENQAVLDEGTWEPEDDPATQATVAQGDTMGCFYIESPAMRLLQKKSKTGDFEHLVLHSSIIRPAANEFIREYLRRLHGGAWDPIHPLLCDVLDETYGIMVYQEDVSKAAMALAGFCDADADALRKIMTKKDKTRRMADFKQRFFEGARARSVTPVQIEAVWEMMMSFSGYSFCKPHSASYARVSFQAAFLKTHWPAEFMAAVLSNQGGFYSPFAYVSEARRMGIQILRPDIHHSDIRWKGQKKTLQTGLSAVRHLSAATMARIVAQRQKRPYRSLYDFAGRTRPAEDEVRSLIFAGAFDGICGGKSRAGLLWDLACWQKSARLQQQDLFNGTFHPAPPSFPPQTHLERLRREFEALGFLCDCHPLELYAEALQNLPLIRAVDLPHFAGKQVCFAGLLITGKVVRTKHGDPMEFLTFEDHTGLVETIFFPRAYDRFCAVLDRARPFILEGKVEKDFGVATLTVERVTPIPKP